MKLVLSALILFMVACNGSNTVSPNTPNVYYFDCTVDGMHIRAECCQQPQNITGIFFSAEVNTEIKALATAQHCNIPGSYCFSWAIVILAQQTGNFTPNTFAIQINQGTDIIYYTAHNFNPPRGNVSVTISEINRTGKKLKGSFSGSVMKNVNGTSVEIPIPVSGSFVLPL